MLFRPAFHTCTPTSSPRLLTPPPPPARAQVPCTDTENCSPQTDFSRRDFETAKELAAAKERKLREAEGTIRELTEERHGCDMTKIKALTDLNMREKQLKKSEGAEATLREQVQKHAAEVIRLKEMAASLEGKVTALKTKADSAEKLREKSRNSFASGIAKRRAKMRSLELRLDEARRQLDLQAVGRRCQAALVREAVDTATAELGAEHASELKAQRAAAAAAATLAKEQHREALMAEQSRREAAEEELREERHVVRGAAGQERRGTAQAELNKRALQEALAATESALRSEQTHRGLAVARAETAEAMVNKQSTVSATQRQQERRDKGKVDELNVAREVTAELRARLQEQLGAETPEQRQVAGREAGTMDEDTTKKAPLDLTVTLISPRLFGTNDVTPREREFTRRIVDECGMSFEAFAKANVLFAQKLLGDQLHSNPRLAEALTVCNKAAVSAFYTLGIRDAEIAKEKGSVDPSPYAVGMDGGNKDRAMNLIALSCWCYIKRKPYLRPLACSDLLGDQTAKNSAAVVEAALARDGRRPGLLVQTCTDGATAAKAESAAVVTGQQEKAAAARRGAALLSDEELNKLFPPLPAKDLVRVAVKSTCCIHGAVLEENHGLEAAFPGRMLEDWLRLFHELFASAEATLARVLRYIWVDVAKLPGVLYDKCLASIALATSSKWEIIFTICFKLLPILSPYGMHESAAGRATPMLQLFLEKCRAFLRGDLSVDGTKASAAVVAKVRWLSGVLYEGQLVGGIHLIVDVWEQSYHKFWKWAKSPSKYGNFDSPMLRHMIAERVFECTAWYAAARADPKAALPRFQKYAATLGGAKQRELEGRAVAFLQAAEESHETWNGTTWTQADHLFGFLCLEPRRRCFAAAILKHIGADGVAEVAAQDEVDRLMLKRLQAHAADGSLDVQVERLELKKKAITDELRLLASAPPGETALNPVLSLDRTPCLYAKFIPFLFVGFAHNLRIESLVSVLGKLERAHPKAHSQIIDFMFIYRTNNEGERDARRAPDMRSTRGGGARAASKELAAEGRGLRDHSRSKKQLNLLRRQAEQRASRYDDVRRRRGMESAEQKKERWRAGFDLARKELDRVKFEHLASSHAVTAAGNKRRLALTASECALLIPKLHAAAAKVPSVRGSGFKQAKMVAAGKARLAASKQEQQTVQVRLARKRPRNAAELRRCSDERPEQRDPSRQQPARKRKPTFFKGASEEEEEEEEEYAGEEEEDEYVPGAAPPPPAAGAACAKETEEEETEEERAQREERTRRANLIKELRTAAKELKARLNELRGGAHRPTEPWKLKEFKEKMPRYEELKERLLSFDR